MAAMQIPAGYEDFLARFVREYPRLFWQFNFWSGFGGAALSFEIVALFFPSISATPPWGRLLLYGVFGILYAQAFQLKYRRRGRRLE
jgi:hypothetical protein